MTLIAVPDFEDICRENPLMAFSDYTHGQAQYLDLLGARLLKRFSSWEKGCPDFSETYYQFWLWVIGAYEVIRTMDQNGDQFTDGLKAQTKDLKQFLAEIRMPFAKQELRGKAGEPIKGENSVVGIDCDMKFCIRGQDYSAKDTIHRFRKFYAQVTLEAVQGNGN